MTRPEILDFMRSHSGCGRRLHRNGRLRDLTGGSGIGFAASIIGFLRLHVSCLDLLETLALDPDAPCPLGVLVYDNSEPSAVTA